MRLLDLSWQGKWKAKQIANPAYKGQWAPRQIPNPDYFEEEDPFSTLDPIGAAGGSWSERQHAGR